MANRQETVIGEQKAAAPDRLTGEPRLREAGLAGEPRLAGETGRAGEARSDLAPTFTIARNPEPGSKLPYLLRLPLREGPLLLKAADTWPRTSKVYCHPAESWPDSPEIVQEVPVRVCRRLGVAIDLVLDRPRKTGRSSSSPPSTAAGRPSSGSLLGPQPRLGPGSGSRFGEPPAMTSCTSWSTAASATRTGSQTKRQPPTGPRCRLATTASPLRARSSPVVERKTLPDLAARLVDGGLAYSMAELATLPRAAVVVEDRYSQLFKLAHVNAGWVADLLARAQVRYPTVPVVFCETRALAEEWTFRFLGAAVAFCGPDEQ